MAEYSQISPASPVPAPSSKAALSGDDFPRYSTCPICGNPQRYLSRGTHYTCTEICAFTVPAVDHIPHLEAEALAIGETLHLSEDALYTAEMYAKRRARREDRHMGLCSVAY